MVPRCSRSSPPSRNLKNISSSVAQDTPYLLPKTSRPNSVPGVSAGVRFRHPPQSGAWGGTFTSFEDEDGNSFVLAEWDDLTREIEGRRRAIAEKLESSEHRAAQELEIAKQVQARRFHSNGGAPLVAFFVASRRFFMPED